MAGQRVAIFPVSDPVKAALLAWVARSNSDIRILRVVPGEGNRYVIGAPLEDAIVAMLPTDDDRNRVRYIEVPGAETTARIDFRSRDGRLGGEVAISFGPTTQRMLIPVGRSSDGLGYWSSHSLRNDDVRAWWEAVAGDIAIEAALRGDSATMQRLSEDSQSGISSRAMLRRARMVEMASAFSSAGDIFAFDTLMRRRELLARFRDTLDNLSSEDPLYQDTAYWIAWPLFASVYDRPPRGALYDYYRDLFSPERDWALNRFPDEIARRRLALGSHYDTNNEFRNLIAQAESDFLDDEEVSRRVEDWMIEREQRNPSRASRMARLLETDHGVEDLLELLQHDEGEGPLAWDMVDGAGIFVAWGFVITDSQERRVAAARRLREGHRNVSSAVREVARRLPVLQRRVIDLRLARLSELLDSVEMYNAQLSGITTSDTPQEAMRFLFDWPLFSRLAVALATNGDEPGAVLQQVGAFLLDMPLLRDERSMNDHAIMVILLLSQASEEPGVVERRLCDRLWEAYGPGGPYAESWTGVAAARGLMILGHDDQRAYALRQRLLEAAGGDPPWLLYFLHRADAEESFAYGARTARAMAWIELVEADDRRQR
jgi:hypothetical protein